MSDRIYSDIWAEKLKTEAGEEQVYIHDGTNRYRPNLILPNLLAVKKLRDYLDKICSEQKNKKTIKKYGW